MSSRPEVSIIVLTYLNWDRYSRDFLEQVKYKTTDVDFEVICVNNGNGKKITEDFDKHFGNDPRFKMVDSDENLGFAGGNNLGASLAVGKHLLFINDDIKINSPKWLFKLLHAKDDSNVVGAQLIKDNSLTNYKGTPEPYLGGWCVLLTREEFNGIGGWEETFGKAFYEDVWFSYLLKKRGKKLVEVETGLEHLGSKTVSRMDVSSFTNFAGHVYQSLRSMDAEKKRIVFYYSGYGIIDSDYEGRGVGGAEASLIQLARQLVKKGWRVEVYSQTQVTGNFNGVWYLNISEFNPFEYCDVFVLWRDAYILLEGVLAKTKIFFSCDQKTSGDWNVDIFPFVDRVVCISEFHRDYLVKNYNIGRKDITILDLGVKEEDYAVSRPKKRNKMIFCSVPERGLDLMARAFLKIQEAIPDVELVITSDYRLWGQKDPLNAHFIRMFEPLSNVRFLGKIPREELVEEQLTSEIMSYPCHYHENFCISAMECIASGTPPVTFDIGAMKTTVGDSGVVINADPNADSDAAVAHFSIEVIELLKDRSRLKKLSEEGKKRALTKYSWGYLGEKYSNFFKEYLEKGEEVDMQKCEICGKQFKSAFDMFTHRAEEHTGGIIHVSPGQKLIMVINTTKDIELSLNQLNLKGKTHRVPKESSGDIIRILKGAYGEDIIESARTMSS